MENEVEILMSSRNNLMEKYGRDGFSQIDKAIVELKESIESSGVESNILWVESADPGEVRKEIAEAEKKFTPRRISLLIIGDDEIIPFFRLKNEVEDGDPHIWSDAPYASSDESWIIPERAVGRIPGTEKVDFLLKVLRNTARKHRVEGVNPRKKNGFGYSTSKWKAASKAVYRAVSLKERIRLSPPVAKDNFRTKWLEKKSFLYFNLHGVKDSKEWYGERAPLDPGDYPVFPVALQPDLIHGVSGAVVFSEACYGGHVLNKEPKNSIALRFLEQNVDCFVGSSAIAYGPYKPPSTEADLLCKYFLQYVERGTTYGNAFVNAKRDFIKKMLRIQGYLDEDDTKTLLEFNLFGDPGLKWRAKE